MRNAATVCCVYYTGRMREFKCTKDPQAEGEKANTQNIWSKIDNRPYQTHKNTFILLNEQIFWQCDQIK